MADSELKLQVIREITKGTTRDGQVRVGPSQIGNPCPRCLARALLATEVDDSRDFSMYPWLGTAVHSYLEQNTFPDAQHELKLYCGDVKNYGPIKGTTDMYLDGIVVDWKIVGLKKIKEYRYKGPLDQYRYQAMIYGKGCVLAGLPVDSVAICFIPRDSGDVKDIWIHEEEYQPEMADAALERAGLIYEKALAVGWESLPSYEDCWTCKTNW